MRRGDGNVNAPVEAAMWEAAGDSTNDERPTAVTLLYHFFRPDDVVSARQFSDLGESLVAKGWEVIARPCNRTWIAQYPLPPLALREQWQGVDIRRVWRPAVEQASNLGRAFNAAWMLTAWTLVAAFGRRGPRRETVGGEREAQREGGEETPTGKRDSPLLLRRLRKSGQSPAEVVIIGTDPVFAVLVALPWRLFRPRATIVHWCFDAYPDAAVAEGVVTANSWLVRALSRLVGAAYRRCDLIADLGPCMARRLAGYLGGAEGELGPRIARRTPIVGEREHCVAGGEDEPRKARKSQKEERGTRVGLEGEGEPRIARMSRMGAGNGMRMDADAVDMRGSAEGGAGVKGEFTTDGAEGAAQEGELRKEVSSRDGGPGGVDEANWDGGQSPSAVRVARKATALDGFGETQNGQSSVVLETAEMPLVSGVRQVTITPWALIEPASPPAADPDARAVLFGNATLGLLYSGSFGRAHSYVEFLALARALRGEGDWPATGCETDGEGLEEGSERDPDGGTESERGQSPSVPKNPQKGPAPGREGTVPGREGRVAFCFAGRGHRAEELRSAVTGEDTNIRFAGFAPEAELERRLAACDIHLVSLRPEWTGTVVPSKFFGALAAGRAVVFAGSPDSSIAQWIREFRVGWVLTPETVGPVAAELRRLAAAPEGLQELRGHCHRVYHEQFSRRRMTERWLAELERALGE